MFGTTQPNTTSTSQNSTFNCGTSGLSFNFGLTGVTLGETPLGGKRSTTATNQLKEGFLTNTLPDDVLEYCKCNYCNCYATVAPIRMIDNKIACGRCKRDTEGARLMIVEVLAKQFNFPCRYRNTGCKSILKWETIDAHEKVCNYKVIRCTVANCEWENAKLLLKTHFEEKHSDEIIHSRRGVVVNLQEKNSLNYLYVSKNNLFLVQLCNDGEKINHQIKFFCTSFERSIYVYDICVYDAQKKLTYLNQKLQSFDDETGVCNTGLTANELQLFFTENKVNILFEIKRFGNDPGNLSMQNIECPVCFEPMLENIMIGVCGHSVCQKCKPSLQNCPSCRSPFGISNSSSSFGGSSPAAKRVSDIRNYSLEALIKKLNPVL